LIRDPEPQAMSFAALDPDFRQDDEEEEGMRMAKIGFIGLGNMGGGMALNLAKAQHRVTAFDLSEAALAKAVEGGCHAAASAVEAATDVDAVVTMLPAGKHVAGVYEELFPILAPGTLLIDCSTIDVATARANADKAAAAGFEAVDAPVSGGIAAANGGTLTFMVGGTPEAFARAEVILAKMGKAVIHAGTNGAGQSAKICNNLILASQMIGTCEGLALAVRLGLDPQTFFDIASKATGQSWSLNSYCPLPGVGPESPADRGYEGGFAAALMLKDLKLALAAAHGVDAAVPMGSAAEALYQAMVNGGSGGKDFSGIIGLLDGKLPG
jgi:3-hydroxyisobutyrate dehydrogenase